MKIPNSFLTDLTFSEFAVAVKLYSLVNSHTKVNGKGFEVCIKQSTLSKHSGLSESTVKRVLRALEFKGIVIGKYRQKGTGGFLGAYHYTLKPFFFLSDYFIMPNRVFVHRLSPKLLFVYSLCHKLKRNGSMDFFHSYNDMAKMLGMKRSEVIWCINELIRRKLVHRQRKRTKSGDYTDNTYIIARYEKGQIKRKGIALSIRFQFRSLQRNLFELSLSLYFSVSHFFKSVKSKFEKKTKNSKDFSLRGGG